MTPGSFIVDHSTLLARSHRDYMRSQCDSSTLSTRSYWAFCALSAPKSFSLRFHYGFNAFATRSLCLHYVYSATSSVYFLILAGVCTPSKINCSHTYLRSWWRSHCVFENIKPEAKRNKVSKSNLVTSQRRNRVAMSYLERQTLTLVLSMFKTSAEGRRSGESDIDAVQSPWQREWSLMSVLRTKQKHKKSELGSQNLPMWPVADLGGEGAHPARAPLFET